MVDDFISQLKAAQGITSLTEYILIDERKDGYSDFRLEIQPEQTADQGFIRLRVTHSKGGGRSRKAYTWPVQDPTHPIELKQIADRIVAAAQPDAEVIDPRSAIGRWFDRLVGSKLINHIPEVARTLEEPPDIMSALIRDDRHGSSVWLQMRKKGRATRYLSIPLASIEVLASKLAAFG